MRQLRRFVGIIAFYKKFIPKCAKIMRPIYALLSPQRYSKKAVLWNDEAEKAFHEIIAKISSPVTLAYPVKNAPTYLVTDASEIAAGAVLHQKINGDLRPLGFFSRAFNNAQLKYSVFDKELTAIHMAVKHFKYFLEGRKFKIVTDQRSLTNAILSKSDNLSPRQSRYIDFIAQYSTDIVYIPGSTNVVADCLSRTQCNALFESIPPISMIELATAQQNDSDLLKFLNSENSKLNVEMRSISDCDLNLIGDVSTGEFRPIVPNCLRKDVFNIFHSLSHPGVRATRELICKRFVWPCMNTDIANWVKSCLDCQMAKIQRHNKAPLKTFLTPDARFEHIHIDVIGPLPLSKGNCYALTVIDRFTRWGEVIPLAGITTDDIISGFLLHWVARFGCPSVITCDRGPQFTSTLWQSLCLFLGSKLSHTCAYHPSANGMCERFNKQVKTSLRAFPDSDWVTNLPWVLLGIRSSLKEDLGCSAAQLALGTSVRLPGQYFDEVQVNNLTPFEYFDRLNCFISSLRPVPPRPVADSSYVDPALQQAEYVFVRNDATRPPLTKVYFGPFKVVYRTDKYFTLLQNGNFNNVSIDRLKTAHLPLTSKNNEPFPDDPSTVQFDNTNPGDSFRLRFPSTDDDSLLPSNDNLISKETPPQENIFKRTRHGRVIRPPVKLDL